MALESFLGKNRITRLPSNAELKLKSAEKTLLIKDINGFTHKSSEINIAWKNVALKSPKQISRQVLGPFASFESAQRFALLLERKGIHCVVAHPKDWEVWFDEGTIKYQ